MKAATRTAAFFVTFVVMMLIDRAVFIAVYGGATGAGASELWGNALWQGLSMDCSVAGYLTVIPALLTIAALLTHRRWPAIAERVYFILVATTISLIFILDLGLYSYWGFRLDTTPIFYFSTSPTSAMASAQWWETGGGIILIVLCCIAIYKALTLISRINPNQQTHRRLNLTLAAMAAAVLFLPIRGGVTTSTMNPSRAYYSSNTRLNHIAVNPIFSLLYSATHQSGFNRQFRYFADDAAAASHLPLSDGSAADGLALTSTEPDIYLIILESFSAHLMPSLGGESIAVNLDSIARSGVLFTRFYANSFRTDRALPAILSAFPSQPTASIMKYTDKVERLPGIASELKRLANYSTSYYYGGDINFTNQLAYVRSTGFERVVSDKDFPLSQRTGKWGAHDHTLFERAYNDMRIHRSAMQPVFTVIQTSSSHEPFEVPYRSGRLPDGSPENAFAYTDSCLSAFVNETERSSNRPTIFVIVPDHYGAWPPRDSLPQFASRHHIPLVLTGSALKNRGLTIATIGSQNDIAATLLGLLGLDTPAFPFSHDMRRHDVPHFAWISEPDLAGIITDRGTGVIDINTGQPASGTTDPSLTNAAKAWLQILYTALGN